MDLHQYSCRADARNWPLNHPESSIIILNQWISMNYSNSAVLKGNGQNGHSFMVIGSNGLTNLCHVSSAARCQRAKGPSLGSYLAQLSGSFRQMSHNCLTCTWSRADIYGIFWYLAAFYQMLKSVRTDPAGSAAGSCTNLLNASQKSPEPLSWPGLSRSGRGASWSSWRHLFSIQ